MTRRGWTITLSKLFEEERERCRLRLAKQAAFAGLRSSPAAAAEKALSDLKAFDDFLDAVSALDKPGKGPETLPVAYDEYAKPIPHFRKLELRPWVAYFYLDTSDPERLRASGVTMFHEDDAPQSLQRVLKAMR